MDLQEYESCSERESLEQRDYSDSYERVLEEDWYYGEEYESSGG